MKQEELPLSKFVTSITNQKLWEKLLREKTSNIKTLTEVKTQNSSDRRHNRSKIPPALAKENKIKQEPVRKIPERQNRDYTKTKYKTNNYENTTQKKNNCGFCGQQNWTPTIYSRQKP